MSFQFGGTLIIHNRWNFTGFCMIQTRGEVFLPPLTLLITVDQKPITNIPQGTIERLTTSCKLFRATAYASKIIAIFGGFCYFFAEPEFQHVALTPLAPL